MQIRKLQFQFAICLGLALFMIPIMIGCAVYEKSFYYVVLAQIILMVLSQMAGNFFRDLISQARLLPKNKIHRLLREQRIFRPLANHLLKVAGVPTRIPFGAMNALELADDGHTRDGSPLDWPVFWDNPDPRFDEWFWRRTDKPIVAVQKPDGTWESQSVSY